MNKVVVILLAVCLSACATYKISPVDEVSEAAKASDDITITKANKISTGFQCHEPLIYLLTLGLIPTYCTDTYRVVSDSEELGEVKVTSTYGWIAFFLFPLPTWELGDGFEVESEIYDRVKSSEDDD